MTEWFGLNRLDRPGTAEQREFVTLALGNTTDLAILEGPPGSGKTTAICELILQLVKAGKRVLMCASTHVAVDNVLERLKAPKNPLRDMVIAVRIGDTHKVSQDAAPWCLQEFARSERRRLLAHLAQAKPETGSQQALRGVLQEGDEAIERLVLDSANLVCGTTIGILKHPDLREARKTWSGPPFDVLILDEASKTTFGEFLVPALWAQKWILVGDRRQLSPFVDDAAVAANLAACLPDAGLGEVCLDLFRAADARNPRPVLVVDADKATLDRYRAQAQARGLRPIDLADASDDEVRQGRVLFGDSVTAASRAGVLPPELVSRGARRTSAIGGPSGTDEETWSQQLAWRLAGHFQQRLDGGARAESLKAAITELCPALALDPLGRVQAGIERVTQVALPSVLEALQVGVGRPQDNRGCALTDGLGPALASRHVPLTHQHRMHPEISAFSREHVYKGAALHHAPDLEARRRWTYDRHVRRAVWLDVRGRFDGDLNHNAEEAHVVLEEVKAFEVWARTNARPDGHPRWELAILSFYRGQEKELRQRLRFWTGQRAEGRRFDVGEHLRIELCTVDRFQGHEADVVVISFANDHATSFLESANRLNVALTRARYLRVVVGNRDSLRRARGPVLKALADSSAWEQPLGRGGGS